MEFLEELKNDAKRALMAQNFDEALRLYTRALSRYPNDAQLYASRAGVYNCKRDFQNSLLDIDKSLEKDSTFVNSYVIQGYALQGLGEYAKALNSYRIANQMDSSNVKIKDLIEKCETRLKEEQERDITIQTEENEIFANILEKLKQSDRFRGYLQDRQYLNSLELLTKSPQLSQIIGKQDSRIKDTIEYLLDDLDPENLKNEDMFSEPKKDQSQIFKLDKEQREILEKLRIEAKRELEEKNYRQSLKICDQCIDTDIYGEFLAFRTFKLGCLTGLKDYKAAETFVEQTLEFVEKVASKDRVQLAKIFQGYALVLQKQEKYLEACATYERCLKMCKSEVIQKMFQECQKLHEKQLFFKEHPKLKSSEDHQILGDQLFKVGKIEESIEEYNLSIQDHKNVLSFIGLSNCYVKKRDLQQAMHFIEEALHTQNTNVNAWGKKGFIHLLLQQYREAKVSFELGLETDPNHQECLRGLQRAKDILETLRNQELAQKVEQALEDAELKEILLDPEIRNLIQYLSENQHEIPNFLENQTIKTKLEKLIQAGFIKFEPKPKPNMVSTGFEMNDPTVFDKKPVMVSQGFEMNDPTVIDRLFKQNNNQQ